MIDSRSIVAFSLLLLSAAGCSEKPVGGRAEKLAARVQVAKAMTKDMPIRGAAIGNVVPINAISVQAQVDGIINGVHFKEGQSVKKGDLLFEIDPRESKAALDQAKAVLAADQAQSRTAEAERARSTALFTRNAASKSELDSVIGKADAAKAQLDIDKAQIEKAEIILGYCTIRSPLDGIIGKRLVDPGNLVRASQAQSLATIIQIKPIFVEFKIAERYLLPLRALYAQNEVKVTAVLQNPAADVSALDSGKPEVGTLTFLDNQVDSQTGTIALRGTFTNTADRLWPGRYVEVEVVAAIQPNVVVIPAAAVMNGPDGPYAYVIENDKAAVRVIKVARTSDQEAIIASGLKGGEVVATDGQLRLFDGAGVKVVD